MQIRVLPLSAARVRVVTLLPSLAQHQSHQRQMIRPRSTGNRTATEHQYAHRCARDQRSERPSRDLPPPHGSTSAVRIAGELSDRFGEPTCSSQSCALFTTGTRCLGALDDGPDILGRHEC